MKLRFDEEADALYLRLDDSQIIESEQVSPGVVLDFNDQNQVVAVEILGLCKRVDKAKLRQFQYEAVGRSMTNCPVAPPPPRATIWVMPVDDILMDAELHMENAIEHLQHELKGIRTGRASPGLVDHIKVDYYGAPTDLRAIAAISVPEATQILIKPFSPTDLRAIEKAINDSKIGLTPHSDGKQLRLMLPPLSQERRLQLAGQCKQYAETSKISIRGARRDANKILETEEKGGVVTEDDSKKGKEKIQELTKTYEAKVDELIEKKRAEIMQV